MLLHVISWNACEVKNYSILAALKSYVSHQHPQVIFIQEGFMVVLYLGKRLPRLLATFRMFTSPEMVSSVTFIPPFLTTLSTVLLMMI